MNFLGSRRAMGLPGYGCDILPPMNYRHEHAHIEDLHLEVWAADDRVHWRVDNLKTHERLGFGESWDFETAKAEAGDCVSDHTEWKAIG